MISVKCVFVCIQVKCIRAQSLMETLALGLRNPTFLGLMINTVILLWMESLAGNLSMHSKTHTQSQQIMRLPAYSHITPLNIETKSTRGLNLSYIFNL